MAEVDIAKYAAQFVQLRDKIKELDAEHDLKMKPYKEAKFQLEAIFSAQLNASNVNSMKTDGGTISGTERVSATIEDMAAFRTFVVNMGEWDLADVKANGPAVREWTEVNKQQPPGVKMTIMRTISVRRPSST